MTTTTSCFEAPRASPYLQQLCKHFAHKTEVNFDETSGTVALAVARARLAVDDQGLTVMLDVDAPEQVTRVRGMIDSHLKRFAFREEFEHMDWQEQTPVEPMLRLRWKPVTSWLQLSVTRAETP